MQDKKIWFISGISSGLGKSLAKAVIASGDFVVGTFRQKNQVAAFNTENDGKALGILLDITDHDAIEKAITEIKDNYGRIDVLVNNAGIGFVGAIEESSLSESRTVFEANFFGVLKLTQEVLPLMRKQGSGHIIQISSHGGVKAFAGFGIYNASKFALEGFSEALQQEVAPLGIKLSIVEPGPFRTNFAGSGLQSAKKEIDDYRPTAGKFRSRLKGVHQKQEGDPAKAAKAIIALTNSESPSLRLPLGKMAVKTIGMKIKSLQSDLEANKEIAEAAVFAS